MKKIVVPAGSAITADKTYFTIPDSNNQTVVFMCGERSVEFRWRDVFDILFSIAQRKNKSQSASERVYGTDGHEGHWFTGEEIVRCRDCKHFSIDNSDHDYRSGWWCHRWNTDMVKPDGYCAWGEIRE